jgi:hypothetical protein
MAMLYDNLPGINVTLKDGGLIIPESGGSESILVIAPSLAPNAPEEPVLVRSSNDLVANGFGDFYVNGQINPIAAEWKAATDSGAKAVYLVALREIDAEQAAELEQDAIDAFVANGGTLVSAQSKFQAVLTGTTEAASLRRKFVFFYDLLMGTLLDFTVDHVVLKGITLEDEATNLDGAFFPEVQNADEFPNIAGMVNYSHVLTGTGFNYPLTITTGTNDKLVLTVNGTAQTFTLTAKTYDGSALTVNDLATDIQAKLNASATGLVAKVNADNGVISIHFEQAVSVAAGTTAQIGLAGTTVYTKTANGLISKGSFAQTIGDYCATKTLMKQATLGYIGVKTPVDTKVSTIRKYVDGLLQLDTEISPYLSVVASETGVVIPGTNAIYYVNGATNYAAIVANLRPESAPTNKQVKGVKSIRFEYSLRQLSRLTGKKMVTFRVKDGTTLVVTDGITTAPSLKMAGKVIESDFARLSTLRITQLAIEVVRDAVDPFIGEANQMPQYNALNTAIKSALEKIREAGAIQGYTFKIANVSARLDQATVLLSIVPAFELRRIDVEVNLAPSDSMLAGLL